MGSLTRLSFTPAEYQRRWGAAQEAMAAQGVSALVLSNLSNICYLSGFQTIGSYGYGVYALVLPPKGEPLLFASDFESHNAEIVSPLREIVRYRVQEQVKSSLIERLAQLLRDRGWDSGRIGCETEHFGLTGRQFQTLRTRLTGAQWVDATPVVEGVRIVKSAEEIAVMRRAAELTTAGMLAGMEAAKEGGADNDVAAAVYAKVLSGGGEYFSLQPIVTSGRRSGIPHSTFRRERLKRGDVVFMEVSACFERYSAPALRAVSIGEPPKEARRAFEACKASVTTTLANLRPGASAREAACRAGRALRAIAPDLVWHGYYGYSVGLNFPPMGNDCMLLGDITEETDYELRAGMVFHINTSLRKVGEFGVTMGDTVLVTDTGCETLTQLPQELTVR